MLTGLNTLLSTLLSAACIDRAEWLRTSLAFCAAATSRCAAAFWFARPTARSLSAKEALCFAANAASDFCSSIPDLATTRSYSAVMSASFFAATLAAFSAAASCVASTRWCCSAACSAADTLAANAASVRGAARSRASCAAA